MVLELLNDTPAKHLELALLNTLCSGVSQSLEDTAVQDVCLHRLLQCLASALETETEVSEPVLEAVQDSLAVVKVTDFAAFCGYGGN